MDEATVRRIVREEVTTALKGQCTILVKDGPAHTIQTPEGGGLAGNLSEVMRTRSPLRPTQG